jgi:glutamate/tyrosine decarboxylase-like PLP-dependent enzyme
MAQPAFKLRISNLTAVIWRNYSGEKGSTWYSVNCSRSYKNGDDQWRETDSLGFDDLLTMAKLLDEAHSWIAKQMQADAKARKEQNATTAA